MSDNNAASAKGGAPLASPKLVKNSKGNILPTNQLAHVQYGCEHIQLLLENARSSTLKQYRAILQKIFEEPSIITQTYKGPDGEPVVTLEPIYLCLQCPLIAPDYERDQHIDNKGHIFSADSRHGYIYCGHCRDIIYDPELEIRRLQKGRKRKVEDLTTAEDHKLTISNANFPPCRAIGLRGLYNMGQTCFMSVVLQTLLHNPFVRNFYLAEGHKKEDCARSEGCVSCALDEMFSEFYSSDKTEGFGAVNMLQASWLAGEALAGYSQQDAHEYMQFMLNTLHLQNDGTSEQDCRCVIHQTFYGKLCSTVTCDKCKNTTTALDPYMDLSLDVKNNQKRKLDVPAEEAQLNLRSCLGRFTSREKLGSDDYTCQSCKERQSATKQLSIKQLPPMLAIHLKRFEHTNSTSSKIETKINFPMEMDLYPFTTAHKSTQMKNPKSSESPKNTNHNINNPANTLMYDLAGVIVHKGQIDSGHYVNYTRDRGEWFLFDDSKVVLVSEADVLGAQAYILFYVASSIDV